MSDKNCRYCSRPFPSASSRTSHENACPEMRYFADFVLKNSTLLPKTALVGGVETSDPRVIEIVKAAQQPPAVASTRHICQFCFHDWAEHYDGSKCPKCGKEQPAADTGAGDASLLCGACGKPRNAHFGRGKVFCKGQATGWTEPKP